MALMGYEWLVIVGVLVVIFLWGPSKLPELARSIGLARKEFDKASKEITNPTTSTAAESSSADSLIVAARDMGITTEGKTKEEIAKEIAERASKK